MNNNKSYRLDFKKSNKINDNSSSLFHLPIINIIFSFYYMISKFKKKFKISNNNEKESKANPFIAIGNMNQINFFFEKLSNDLFY